MSLKPPKNFNFLSPQDWPTWKRNFLRFHTATSLGDKTELIQVANLIYAMGPEADRILDTFTMTEADRNKFAPVLAKFDEYFVPKRNIIHERAQFHRCSQKENETVDEYVRRLYDAAQYADFADKDNTIRDRLVLGLVDSEISEKLQLEDNLTLDKAISIAKRDDSVKKQLKEQRHVDAVRKDKGGRGQQKERHSNSGGANPGKGGKPKVRHQKTGQSLCNFCGYEHPPRQCPAYGKRCKFCEGRHHFERVCNKKKKENSARQNEVQVSYQSSDSDDVAYLMSVDSDKEPWRQDLIVDGCSLTFKIDTGADVSCMSYECYKQLKTPPPLMNTTTILKSPGGVIDCLGKARLQVSVKGNKHEILVYVIRGHLKENLLSRSDCVAMNLVQRVDDLYGSIEKPINRPPVHIELKAEHEPYSVKTARRIPIPLYEKVGEELKQMEKQGIIEKIDMPTDWCAPIVPVLKPNGKVRITTDFKKLNNAVKRERYMLPCVEEVLQRMSGSKVFSKLDARSGYFQIPLDSESAKLTTFITPFGRFFYKRLPQGISSAPEIFQKYMENILEGQPNVEVFMDDIMVHSENDEVHEKHLATAMESLSAAGVKLNKEKEELRRKEIKFLGHIISGDGIRPDPEKIQAIIGMNEPENIQELRRFLGMVNFLGRHLKNLSTVLNPMTELLNSDTAWTWGPAQREAMAAVKKLVTTAPTLALYNPELDTTVQADASSYGLGAVLLQTQKNGDILPVAYASRTLTRAEKNYAQIEKECLGVVWGCERFSRYLIGLPQFTIETDHKPLIPLINTRDLSETPLRCQRLLMRLASFNIVAKYVQGKDMHVSDALSRDPLKSADSVTEEEVEMHVHQVEYSWPMTDTGLERIAKATQEDVTLRAAFEYTVNGWPRRKEDAVIAARDLYAIRGELSVSDGLLLKGEQIVIPPDLRGEILEKIHAGHLGLNKSRERAKDAVWWPQITRDIKDMIGKCHFCIERKPTQIKEPMQTSELPARPYQKVGADLLTHKSDQFLVVRDYYSRYIDIAYLPEQNSKTVIAKMKNIFAHHGVPQLLVTDNGSQFACTEFEKFTSDWNVSHETPSPRYPQANGAAESAVKTAKFILKQDDPFLALLSYRATPIPELGASPAELMFGRKIRTTLPVTHRSLSQKPIEEEELRERDAIWKQRQKSNFDRRHGARPLSELQPDEPVLIKLDNEKGWQLPAKVVEKCAPRSYMVQTPTGQLRRNRRHLKPTTKAHYSEASTRSKLKPSVRQQPAPPIAPPCPPTEPEMLQPTGDQPEMPETGQGGSTEVETPPSPPRLRRSGRQVVKPARYRE